MSEDTTGTGVHEDDLVAASAEPVDADRPQGHSPADLDAVCTQALTVCANTTALGQSAETATQLLDLFGRLQESRDCLRLLQGGVLARLQEHERWRRLRPDLTFAAFCEEVVGCRYRTAKYLIDSFRRLQQLGVTPAQVADLGWTKVRTLLPVARPENIGPLLAAARTETRERLQQRVRQERSRLRGEQGAEDEPLVAWTIMLTSEQRDFVEYVVELTAAVDPPRVLSRGHALELICIDSLANRLPPEQTVAWIAAQVRRISGVELVPAHGSDGDPRR